MPRDPKGVVAEITQFRPVDGDWLPLDSLLAELWQSGAAGNYVAELLAVFERFPTEDGHVMWSLMHGLESLPGLDPLVLQSLVRQPSEMAVLMVGRLLNSGVQEVSGMSLVEVLRDVTRSPAAPESVKGSAAGWAARHAA